MKRVVSVIVLVALTLNCAFRLRQKTDPRQDAQYPVVPSAQVGEVIVIDADERAELNLFPGFNGFQKAQVIVTSGGGYEVEIVTETKRYVSFNNDPDAVAILLDYTENYDEIEYDRAAFEARWGVIDYDTLGFPITHSQVNRTIGIGGGSVCGCGGGLAAGLAAGIGLGALAIAEARGANEGGADMGVGMGILFGGLAIAVIVGGVVALSTGCLTAHIVHGEDLKRAVEKIKEARLPRVV